MGRPTALSRAAIRRTTGVLASGVVIVTAFAAPPTHASSPTPASQPAHSGVAARHAHAPAASAKPRPDLVIKAGGVKLQGGGYYFVDDGDDGVFNWKQTTKNVGGALARKSSTGFRFVNGNGALFGGDTIFTSRLKPGESESDHSNFTEVFDQRWKYGTHPMKICADVLDQVKESNEKNNCRRIHDFYLIPLAIRGTITGTAPLHQDLLAGVTLSWSGEVTYVASDKQTAQRIGQFEWETLPGTTIHYEVSGTDPDGCTWSGGGDYPAASLPADFAMLFGKTPRFAGRNPVDQHWSFTDTRACPDGTGHDQVAPWVYGLEYWLDTGSPRVFDDPGVRRLRGGYTDSRPTGATTYHWDLALRAS